MQVLIRLKSRSEKIPIFFHLAANRGRLKSRKVKFVKTQKSNPIEFHKITIIVICTWYMYINTQRKNRIIFV